MARTRKTDLPEDQTPQTDVTAAADTPPAEEVALSEPFRNPSPADPVEVTTDRAPSPPPRRRGLSVLAGGVLAALAGSAATIYALPNLPEPLRTAILPADLAPDDTRLTAMEASLSSLQAAVDSRGNAPDPTAELTGLAERTGTALSGLTDRLAKLETTLAGLSDQVTSVDGRLTSLEKRPVSGGAASATALDAFSRELSDLKAQIAAGSAGSGAAAEEIKAAADAAAERIKAAEAEAARLAEEARAAGEKAAARAALSHVEAALENGAPIENALADLAAAGVDVPPTLAEQAKGVPSLAMLRDSFPEAARDALVLSLKETAGDGFWSKAGAFLKSQSGARSLTPRAGTDPDAVLSRSEAALGTGDLATAVAELQTLPESGRARMAEWIGLAERRMTAVSAVADLSAAVD